MRAEIEVTVASVMPEKQLQCKMARGLKVVADVMIEECAGQEYDAIACPGGMPGAQHLHDSAVLTDLLKKQAAKGKVVAAVCAAPAVILKPHGLLPAEGDVTCFPVDKFKTIVGPNWSDTRAVVNGNVITSQGPGTSLEFALEIVQKLCGKDVKDSVEAGLLIKP